MGVVFFLGLVLTVVCAAAGAAFLVFLANRISRLAFDRGYDGKRYFWLSLFLPFVMVPLISYLPVRPRPEISVSKERARTHREWLRVILTFFGVLILAAVVVTVSLLAAQNG